MKKVVLLFPAFILFALLLHSCRHIKESFTVIPPGTNPPVVGGEQTCSADTTYFQNKVLPLIISSCAKSNCHDAASHQDGVQLTSYLTIMNTADVRPGNPGGSKLYKVLNETDPDKRMPRPPAASFTAAEKDIIYKWILQGAKNNACNDCDTSVITYSAAVAPIINFNCRGCHNPTSLNAGLDLSSYNIVRSIAVNGKFMSVISHSPGSPAMPQGAAMLNNCKIAQVRKWIAAGAQNN